MGSAPVSTFLLAVHWVPVFIILSGRRYIMEPATSLISITTEMFQPLLDTVSSTLTVLLPIGLALLGITIGVALIPRIIWKFF